MGAQTLGEKGGKVRKASEQEREGPRHHRLQHGVVGMGRRSRLLWEPEVTPLFWALFSNGGADKGKFEDVGGGK